MRNTVRTSLGLLTVVIIGIVFAPEQNKVSAASASSKKKPAETLDYSGQTHHGKASYYSKKSAGKTMADGTPMDLQANIAASRTLPLGTTVKVTNLDNGKSAVVVIRDRGPYIAARIIDVSPEIARQLAFTQEGIATVAVTPIELPSRTKAATQ